MCEILRGRCWLSAVCFGFVTVVQHCLDSLVCFPVGLSDHRPLLRQGYSPHKISVFFIFPYELTDVKLVLQVTENSRLHRLSNVTLLERSSQHIIILFTRARYQYGALLNKKQFLVVFEVWPVFQGWTFDFVGCIICAGLLYQVHAEDIQAGLPQRCRDRDMSRM